MLGTGAWLYLQNVHANAIFVTIRVNENAAVASCYTSKHGW